MFSVTSLQNRRIRKISPNGFVSSVAGTGVAVSSDGWGTNAGVQPSDVAVDPTTNAVYFTDSAALIRKLAPNGLVTTIARAGNWFADGYGTTIIMGAFQGIDVDVSGFVYFYESNNFKVRKVIPNGLVSSCPGGSYSTVINPACLPCPSGMFCPVGAITPLPCATGFICPATSTASAILCSPGRFCNAGMLTASLSCPIGFYCPFFGMSAALVCPNGTSCPLAGLSVAQPCPAGSYCPTPSNRIPCPAGRYNPITSVSTMSSCLVCLPAVCPGAGNSLATTLLADTTKPVTGLRIVNAGSVLGAGATIYSAPAMFALPISGSQWYPTDLSNSWVQLDLGRAVVLTGMAIASLGDTTHDCVNFTLTSFADAAFVVQIANTGVLQLSSGVSSYQYANFPSPLVTQYLQYTCVNQVSGNAGAAITQMRFAGLCSDPLCATCGLESGTCLMCQNGYMQTNSSDTRSPCIPCPLGSFCVGSIAITCPAGSYTPRLAASVCVNCTVGTYCSAGSPVPVTCPTGHYCPARSNVPILCPSNFYCNISMSAPTICPTISVAAGLPALGNFLAPPGASNVPSCNLPVVNTFVRNINSPATGIVGPDANGSFYFASQADHTVKIIDAFGFVRPFAGRLFATGSIDGVGTNATFNAPANLALDTSGNIYVAARNNHAIRKITPSGSMSQLSFFPCFYSCVYNSNAIYFLHSHVQM